LTFIRHLINFQSIVSEVLIISKPSITRRFWFSKMETSLLRVHLIYLQSKKEFFKIFRLNMPLFQVIFTILADTHLFHVPTLG
jgi:hypothetical protein